MKATGVSLPARGGHEGAGLTAARWLGAWHGASLLSGSRELWDQRPEDGVSCDAAQALCLSPRLHLPLTDTGDRTVGPGGRGDLNKLQPSGDQHFLLPHLSCA